MNNFQKTKVSSYIVQNKISDLKLLFTKLVDPCDFLVFKEPILKLKNYIKQKS
jgi:hypothetical protein